MGHGVLVFPVLPGKTEADIRTIAEAFKADPEGYWESRRAGGVTMERAYWQHTPMGDFVIAYVESTAGSMAEGMEVMARDQSRMGRFFREKVLEIHGVDITQPMPAPENIAEWSDPEVTERRKGWAFCAPVIPEMVDYAREWGADAFSRDGMTKSRRALGGNKEIVTLLQTPMGPVTGVYVEATDPVAANVGFAASTSEFDVWFKENLAKIYPPFIDFGQPVPDITEIFDSETVGSAELRGRAAEVATPA